MEPDVAVFARAVHAPESAVDLARAALLVARIEYPALEVTPWVERLDVLARRSGIDSRATPAFRLDRLRRFLFDEEGYRGNAEDYFDPRNSCLNEVLDRRLGIPIALAVVMMEVGRRVGLDIEGVGLPGHFVVRARIGADAVLLDPFNGGRILDRRGAVDVVVRALGHTVTLTEAHFAPTTKSQLIARMLMNLRGIYVQREEWRKALAVIERLLVLDTERPVHLRDHGTVLMKLGDFHAGAAEWERYLRRYPNVKDADRLRSQLRQIRQALASRN